MAISENISPPSQAAQIAGLDSGTLEKTERFTEFGCISQNVENFDYWPGCPDCEIGPT